MMFKSISIVIVLLSILELSPVNGNHCFTCRSRGKFGDCKDPFPFNGTHLTKGVEKIPCASGWCSKKIEGDDHGEDHDLATERGCLQWPPEDQQPRCANAFYGHKTIFLCTCKGELCNGSSQLAVTSLVLLPTIVLLKSFAWI